jgi:protease I
MGHQFFVQGHERPQLGEKTGILATGRFSALRIVDLRSKGNKAQKKEETMSLHGKKVLLMVEELYNDREFWYPYYRLQEEGAQVVVVAPQAGKIYTGAAGIKARSDLAADQAGSNDFAGLIIPGGYAPDHMRRHPAMVRIVADMAAAGKVVAAICHAGWMLASAGIVKGRTVTGFFAIRDDLVHAGASYVDQDVVVDGALITSRTPDDLPAFLKAIIAALQTS